MRREETITGKKKLDIQAFGEWDGFLYDSPKIKVRLLKKLMNKS